MTFGRRPVVERHKENEQEKHLTNGAANSRNTGQCHMASASPSENSLNYGNEKQLDVRGKVEPMAFGRCPELSGAREPGCHMASEIARE